MKKSKDKIIKEGSKINRIIQLEDMIYRFLNNRGKFNIDLNFKNKKQEKIFSDICKKICLRLNTFSEKEETDVVPSSISNAAIEIEKLIPEGEKISEKRFIITLVKWAKNVLFKKKYIKPIPWELIDKIRDVREFELGTRNLESVYNILDEYQVELKEIIESGRSLLSIARELGMSSQQLYLYAQKRNPKWNICPTYKKVKIENIEEVKEYIIKNSIKAMAKKLGCSASYLSIYINKNYPDIMKEIKQHNKKNI